MCLCWCPFGQSKIFIWPASFGGQCSITWFLSLPEFGPEILVLSHEARTQPFTTSCLAQTLKSLTYMRLACIIIIQFALVVLLWWIFLKFSFCFWDTAWKKAHPCLCVVSFQVSWFCFGGPVGIFPSYPGNWASGFVWLTTLFWQFHCLPALYSGRPSLQFISSKWLAVRMFIHQTYIPLNEY